ncbi:hypothetical protein GCM10016455_18210 [Aliiroseovarius zhejiangensis]|uniref:WD40 repeat domain-containing protein n=1 Tax=Aliiroseovarius zhejiangensis TaxID=1632025 RepID=A0ABQ3J0U4_9RHOB|nr:hypothetical protein [Aliiroseovarius zhejiangensis]GHE97931.1 hypothetical protein GCM10016455_18210 [Aliiroseovarius zhejiangensis]
MFDFSARFVIAPMCVFLMFSGQVMAQQEKSLDFVQQSIAATMAGDRDRAIALALRALPDAPTEADLDNYPDAYRALLRAAAARITQVDRSGFQHYAVNWRGDRAVVGAANGPQDGTQDAPPYALFDPRSNEWISDLVAWDVPISMVYGPGLPPAFSPDGDLVAIWAMDEGQVLLFDTMDGTAHAPLDLGGAPGWIAGFSPDGKHLAAVAGGRVAVWDLESRARVTGFWPDQIEAFDVVAWAADSSFIVAQGEVANYEIAAVTLQRHMPDGLSGSVRIDVTGPSIYLTQSPVGATMLVAVGDNQFIADPVMETVTRLAGTGDAAWQLSGTGRRSQRL